MKAKIEQSLPPPPLKYKDIFFQKIKVDFEKSIAIPPPLLNLYVFFQTMKANL